MHYAMCHTKIRSNSLSITTRFASSNLHIGSFFTFSVWICACVFIGNGPACKVELWPKCSYIEVFYHLRSSGRIWTLLRVSLTLFKNPACSLAFYSCSCTCVYMQDSVRISDYILISFSIQCIPLLLIYLPFRVVENIRVVKKLDNTVTPLAFFDQQLQS